MSIVRRLFSQFVLWYVPVIGLLVIDGFRTYQYFQHYDLAFTDFAATYLALLLLVVPALFFILLAGMGLCAVAERIVRTQRLFEAVSVHGWFPLVVTMAYIGLRNLLISFGYPLKTPSVEWQIGGAAAAAFIWSFVRMAGIRSWMHSLEQRARNLTVGVGSLGLAGFLLWLIASPSARPVTSPPDPAAGTGGKPNVFFLILDSFTAEDMSLYGFHLPTTPSLARFADSCTVYDKAYSSSNLTYYSNISMLTGRYPYFADWLRYEDMIQSTSRWTCLPKVLGERGWRTVSIEHFFYPLIYYHPEIYRIDPYYHDIFMGDESVAGALERLVPVRRLKLQKVVELIEYEYFPSVYRRARDVEYRIAEDLLSRNNPPVPLLMVINADRPHFPYLGDEWMGRFLPSDSGLTDVPSQYSHSFREIGEGQATVTNLRLRYDENIAKADQIVAGFIGYLRNTGQYDNSLIIITGDHGETFRGIRQGHGSYSITNEEHHIPLLVKYPHQTAGNRVTTVVRQIDILPTILRECGISLPRQDFDGEVLPRDNHDSTRIALTVGFNLYSRFVNCSDTVGYQVAAVSGSMKYMELDGCSYLFDLKRDPLERRNILADSPGIAIVLQNGIRSFNLLSDTLESSGSDSTAPPVITRLRRGESGSSYRRLISYPAAGIPWVNDSAGFGDCVSGGRLFFGGETRKSSAVIPIPDAATNILLSYHIDDPVTSPGVMNYFDFMDSLGRRVHLESIVAYDRTRDTLSDVRILIPVGTNDSIVRIAFKVPDSSRSSVSSCSIGIFGRSVMLPPGGSRLSVNLAYTGNVYHADDPQFSRHGSDDGKYVYDVGTRSLTMAENGDKIALVGNEGSTITVVNLGAWNAARKFDGLNFVYRRGAWTAETSTMVPVNLNPDLTGSNDTIPGYTVSGPEGARFTVIRMEDAGGPYIRIRADSAAAWLTLMQTDTLARLDGVPVTLKVLVRNGGKAMAASQLFDFYADGKYNQVTAEWTPARSWSWVTIHHRMEVLRPEDYFATGLFNAAAGDWFDIRTLRMYIGWLP